MRPRARLLLLAALTLIAAPLAGCGGGGGGRGGGRASWCVLDDPGTTEHERQRRKLGRDQLDRIACPAPAKASTRPDELALPMPCGRVMLFRRVDVQLGDPLDFEVGSFGDPDASQPFRKAMTGPWRGAVGGAFGGDAAGGGRSFYYIGKYEVTAPQWAVFTGGALDAKPPSDSCAAATKAVDKADGQVLPATRVSLPDAMRFADAYSRWLIRYEHGHGGLGAVVPNNESLPGYVRLPTEEEWEFAARGGATTGSGRTYAVPPGWSGAGAAPDVSEIAWSHDPGAPPPPGSQVFYAGRKSPNRLMLFDMVGNAEELAFGLFRPVRPDGVLGGRVGGAVARGGSAMDGPDGVGVGVRREVEVYGEDGAAAGPATGLRLVVAAPMVANRLGGGGHAMQGNPSFEAGLTNAWTRREKGEGSPGAAERNGALGELDRIRAAATPELAARIGAVQAQLQLASSQVGARDETTAQQQLLTAILTAGYAREKTKKLARFDVQTDAQVRAAGGLDALTPEVRRQLAQFRALLSADLIERDRANDYYASVVVDLSTRDPQQLARAQAAVADRLAREGLVRLVAWAPVVVKHAAEAHGRPPSTATLARWIGDLEAQERAFQAQG